MTESEKLYDAAKLLKENCDEYEWNPERLVCVRKCNGERCLFSDSNGNGCPIGGKLPFDWSIKKPRRFTDEEVALAKAFKIIGAVEIRGCIEGTLVISENDTCLAALPLNVFKGISTITLPIDEIIKDGEE